MVENQLEKGALQGIPGTNLVTIKMVADYYGTTSYVITSLIKHDSKLKNMIKNVKTEDLIKIAENYEDVSIIYKTFVGIYYKGKHIVNLSYSRSIKAITLDGAAYIYDKLRNYGVCTTSNSKVPDISAIEVSGKEEQYEVASPAYMKHWSGLITKINEGRDTDSRSEITVRFGIELVRSIDEVIKGTSITREEFIRRAVEGTLEMIKEGE